MTFYYKVKLTQSIYRFHCERVLNAQVGKKGFNGYLHLRKNSVKS